MRFECRLDGANMCRGDRFGRLALHATFAEPILKLVNGHRTPGIIALNEITVEELHERRLFRRFHTLGDDAH